MKKIEKKTYLNDDSGTRGTIPPRGGKHKNTGCHNKITLTNNATPDICVSDFNSEAFQQRGVSITKL